MLIKRGLFTGTTWFVLLVGLGVLWLPWLGETPFYSKGEPREAIVAMSMLQNGDWILPLDSAGEMPYKPPFLAWLIAIFAWLFNGGVVNEYVSRLPSAIAAIAMIMGGFFWVKKSRGKEFAFTMALVTATSFEVFRASEACRVDMILAAAMVGALYLIYEAREHVGQDNVGIWSGAVGLLSVAVLTKGPVGALLPCLAGGIYLISRRGNVFLVIGKMTLLCLASFMIPALWYYAAWKQGGQPFLDLAWEENILRLTGQMSYESHVKPFWYNFVTILVGMLPWTIFAIFALCRANTYHRWPLKPCGKLALVCSLTIIVFYCIPASKRSVYLLPAYPFIAYAVTALIYALQDTGATRFFGRLIAFIGIAAPVVVGIMAAFNNPFDHDFGFAHWWEWIVLAVPVVVTLWWIFGPVKSQVAMPVIWSLLLVYNAVIMPAVFAEPLHTPQARTEFEKLENSSQKLYGFGRYQKFSGYWYNYYLGNKLLTLPDSVIVENMPKGSTLIITNAADTSNLSTRWTISPLGYNPDTRANAFKAIKR